MREFKELDIDTKQFPLHLHACLEHDKINFIVTRMKFWGRFVKISQCEERKKYDTSILPITLLIISKPLQSSLRIYFGERMLQCSKIKRQEDENETI